MVSPPRGLTGRGVGSFQTEEPLRGEEGVGPALIGQAMPGPASPRALLEDGPESAADEAVQLPEDPAAAVLEVLKPAAKRAIQRGDDRGQRVALSPSGPGADRG